MDQNVAKKLTREELYEKIWSMPATQLAAELDITEAALARRCKKLNVPKPRLGYWAKAAAGKTPRKARLPSIPNEVFIQAAEKRLPKVLRLPETTENVRPLAMELMRALNSGKPDSDKLIRVRERTLPQVAITKALIDRVTKSFHVILNGVEPLGIAFRKAHGSYNPGFFQRSGDRLYLGIEEEFVDQFGSSRPSWQWHTGKITAAGVLRFSLKPNLYGMEEVKKWKETKRSSLGRVLAEIVTAIRRHYVEAQKKRTQEAIESTKHRIESERYLREYQEKEAIRIEKERRDNHANALEAVAHGRSQDLLKASEWWRLYRTMVEFIDECEQRWQNSQAGELAAEQQAWLVWARENAKATSPFQIGYPDATEDGAFDPSAVPFGGPYPRKRDLPRPPTIPKTPMQTANSEQTL